MMYSPAPSSKTCMVHVMWFTGRLTAAVEQEHHCTVASNAASNNCLQEHHEACWYPSGCHQNVLSYSTCHMLQGRSVRAKCITCCVHCVLHSCSTLNGLGISGTLPARIQHMDDNNGFGPRKQLLSRGTIPHEWTLVAWFVQYL